jgi:hypothetical protein
VVEVAGADLRAALRERVQTVGLAGDEDQLAGIDAVRVEQQLDDAATEVAGGAGDDDGHGGRLLFAGSGRRERRVVCTRPDDGRVNPAGLPS